MSLNENWEQVKLFHKVFNHPVSDTPIQISAERVKNRCSWMYEEIDEFRNSLSIEEQADAMIDLIYFALGTLVEMGVKPEPIFKIVQEANMGKLWEDGKPRYNDQNKVIKPKNWESPDEKIREEIERQKQNNN